MDGERENWFEKIFRFVFYCTTWAFSQGDEYDEQIQISKKKVHVSKATRDSAVFLWVEKLRISRGNATHIAVYDEMFGFGSRKLCVVWLKRYHASLPVFEDVYDRLQSLTHSNMIVMRGGYMVEHDDVIYDFTNNLLISHTQLSSDIRPARREDISHFSSSRERRERESYAGENNFLMEIDCRW